MNLEHEIKEKLITHDNKVYVMRYDICDVLDVLIYSPATKEMLKLDKDTLSLPLKELIREVHIDNY